MPHSPSALSQSPESGCSLLSVPKGTDSVILKCFVNLGHSWIKTTRICFLSS